MFADLKFPWLSDFFLSAGTMEDVLCYNCTVRGNERKGSPPNKAGW